ncbi:MAG: YgiT-type zinc finger protein [Chloroflexi bacterium]|nr:YgiT-type zinc finger protein [Chloroflexota bacterium]
MNRCRICNAGELREGLVETWMPAGPPLAGWVLFRNVPATVCDTCGEKTFSQETAERLATILDPASRETPSKFLRAPVFDLALIDAAQAKGKKPVAA